MSVADVVEQLQSLIQEELKVGGPPACRRQPLRRARAAARLLAALQPARARSQRPGSPARCARPPQVVSYKWVSRHFSMDPNQAKR
jgi:hypothetical protein